MRHDKTWMCIGYIALNEIEKNSPRIWSFNKYSEGPCMRPSVRPEPIYYIIRDRNPIFSVKIHIGIPDCGSLWPWPLASGLEKSRQKDISILFEVWLASLNVDTTWDPRVSRTALGWLWPWLLASVLEIYCPEHISYIIWGRNPKVGDWVRFGVTECCLL